MVILASMAPSQVGIVRHPLSRQVVILSHRATMVDFGMGRRLPPPGCKLRVYPGCIREDLHVQGSPLSSRPATNFYMGVYKHMELAT